MSQAVRTLAEADVYVRRYTSRRQRRRAVRNVVLVILLAIAGWFFWATRDNWPMARFVPKDPAFQLCATDLLLNRTEIAASRVWDLAPNQAQVADIRKAMAGNFGLPEWVINNLIYGLGLVSGADLATPQNSVFVTRISRIGCVLEKFRGFAKIIEDDPAGGLEIRHVVIADAYYAIRGRVLIASQSRDTLIHALTLHDNEALSEDEFAKVQQAAMGRNLLATLRPNGQDALGASFDRAEMTLALNRDTVQLDCKAIPRDTFAPALNAIFGSGKIPALPAPVQGVAELSLDFGRPFPEVWSGLLLAFPENDALQSARKTFAGIAEGAGDKAPLLDKALGSLGTGFSLSITGVDPYEIVPMPQIIARLDAPHSAGYNVLLRAGLPKAPVADESAMKPYFDDVAKFGLYPFAGGPSMHPSLGFKDDKILFASSAALMRDYLGGNTAVSTSDGEGHALLRVRVAPATAMVFDILQEFAQDNFIRGYNAETFKALADEWKTRAALTGDLTALLAYTNGALQLRVTLEMAPEAAAPAPTQTARATGE